MAKQIIYTDQFRQEAVDMYQEGNRSAAQVARNLGIHEHTLCRWIKLYGKSAVTSKQSAGGQSILHGEHCAKQENDFTYICALKYIHAIKRYIDTLEKLINTKSRH